MDYTQIAVTAAPTILAFIIGYLVKRGLVSKATLSELMVYGQWAVTAAEEAYKEIPESGDAKLQHAMTAMTQKFGISPEEARNIVLATVATLNRQGILGSGKNAAPVQLVTPNDPRTS